MTAFDEDGKPVEGILQLYFADGSTMRHPVIAGKIVYGDRDYGDWQELLPAQKAINDVHDKVVDLSPSEWTDETDS